MYLEFFKLKEFPFSNACDERFFFESEIHAEALSNMVYTIQQRKGMVMITGEVGAGKTFLGSMLASRLGMSALVAVMDHPAGSAKQLLRAVAAGMGVRCPYDSDTLSLVEELLQGLRKLHRRNRLAALVLDEAQDLPDEALEEIRLMWNWEEDRQRLLQIVLIGQPELRSRLLEPRWESLRQRIVLSYHLGRLSASDASQYILHRRAIAAGEDCLLRFTPNAIRLVHEAAKGIPRLINTLCDNALLAAYAKGAHKITSGTISTVVRDMTCWPLEARRGKAAAAEVPPGPSADEAVPEAREAAAAQAGAPPAAEAGELVGPPLGPAPRQMLELVSQEALDPGPAPGEAVGPEGQQRREPAPQPGDLVAPQMLPGTGPTTSAALLRAALQGEPSLDMARRVYKLAPPGSEAHQEAVRIIAQELVAALRNGKGSQHG